jgi:hypothetical protein
MDDNVKLNQTDSAVDKLRLNQANQIENNFIDGTTPGEFKGTARGSTPHIEVRGTNIEVKNNHTYNQLHERQDSIKPSSERDAIKLEEKENLAGEGRNNALDETKYTDRDLAEMSVDDSIKNDKRGFWSYYWKRLTTTHMLLRAFYYKTLWQPQYVRITTFFLSISYYFALNAIFYSDNFITARQSYVQSANQFLQTLQNQLSKSIWSLLIGEIPMILLGLLLIIPAAYKSELNESFKSKDPQIVGNSYGKLHFAMLVRYLLYVIFGFLLHLLAWYYVTVFCGVYISSSVSWICGGFISLIIKLFITQMALPLVHTCVRALCLLCPNRVFKFFFWIVRMGL